MAVHSTRGILVITQIAHFSVISQSVMIEMLYCFSCLQNFYKKNNNLDQTKSSKLKGIRRITDKNFEVLSAEMPREANCKMILQIILLEHCQGLLVQKP